MKTWYTCKVKYTKIDENGKQKNVTEPYLVDAISFTEAEARIYDRISEIVDGDFYVTTIAKNNITDYLKFDDSDYFYNVKVKYVSVDEEAGREKKITNTVLIAATDLQDAYNKMVEDLKTMIVPYEITSVVLSPLVDVFPYENSEEEDEAIPDNLTPVSEYES